MEALEEIIGEETFQGLPGALVDEMIKSAEGLGPKVLEDLEALKALKERARESLKEKNIIRRFVELPQCNPPTTCGVDGAYGIEKMLGYDLVVCTGLAVEGLTPPNESGEWSEPHFEPFMSLERHRDENTVLARALMMCFELQEAIKAPHNIVFIDGSLSTPIIYLNQGLSRLGPPDVQEGKLRSALRNRSSAAVEHYSQILTLQRGDHIFVGVPKYTTRNEIGSALEIQEFDDKALITLMLEPGEFIRPLVMSQPEESGWSGWHLNREYLDSEVKEAAAEVEQALSKLHITYYRPTPYTPALRLEFPEYVALNDSRLGQILRAISDQSAIPGLIEPYPLFYADRMAKSIGVSIPAIRQILTSQSVEDYSGKPEDVFFALHGYRTEKGAP